MRYKTSIAPCRAHSELHVARHGANEAARSRADADSDTAIGPKGFNEHFTARIDDGSVGTKAISPLDKPGELKHLLNSAHVAIERSVDGREQTQGRVAGQNPSILDWNEARAVADTAFHDGAAVIRSDMSRRAQYLRYRAVEGLLISIYSCRSWAHCTFSRWKMDVRA
jgi:hypothetical protein